MAVERIFMGLNKPALHLAVDYMFEEFADGDSWDMSRLLLVLPSRRAVRRLRELLVLRVEHVQTGSSLRLLPPAICTIGELPELLNPPTLAIASDIDHLMAMSHALQTLAPQEAKELVPGAFTCGEVMPWLRAADRLIELRRDLAAAGVTAEDVLESANTPMNDEGIKRRWRLLGVVHRCCRSVLGAAGIHDRDEVREVSINGTAATTAGSQYSAVLMIGITEAPHTARRLLRVCKCPVFALIHANDEDSEGFTEYGTIEADYWYTRNVELDDRRISMVHSPTDQAREVARLAAEMLEPEVGDESLNVKTYPVTADQIFVSCADEGLLGPVERAIELHGIKARPPRLDTASRTPPFIMLGLLAEFLRSYSPEAFATLIRHPDVERWLTREWRNRPGNCPTAQGDTDTAAPSNFRRPIAADLDRYLQQAVPGIIVPGEPSMSAQLNHAAELILGLEQGTNSQRLTPAEWAGPLRSLISTIYNGRRFSSTKLDDMPSAQALTVLGDHLRAWRMTQLPAEVQCLLTFAEALELLTWRAGEIEITPAAEEDAVQLSGWLEVSLDDSPILIITGVNEGSLPRSVSTDPFIPDSLREQLGMACNKSRYAQDLFVLSCAAKCRPALHLVTGRVSADNSALAPSRLLTACNDEQIVARTIRYYTDTATADAAPLLPCTESNSLAMLPMPVAHPVLDRLNVTAFRDYLACPYRFYLRHVLRLRTVEEDPYELAPNQFGDLAHMAMHTYANRVIKRDSGLSNQSISEIADELTSALDDAIGTRMGTAARAAARLQTGRLRARLQAFAAKQYELFGEGWRIIAAEQELNAVLTVDNEPFNIYGRVDRLDVNDHSMQCRILDYKTASRAKTPDQVHRKGRKNEKRWIDLQLPLYVHLAQQYSQPFNSIMPGYILLPASLNEIGIRMADTWDSDDLAAADAAARYVIQGVRNQCFWPPSDPDGLFKDGFERVALDTYPDRAGIIKRQSERCSTTSGELNAETTICQ